MKRLFAWVVCLTCVCALMSFGLAQSQDDSQHTDEIGLRILEAIETGGMTISSKEATVEINETNFGLTKWFQYMPDPNIILMTVYDVDDMEKLFFVGLLFNDSLLYTSGAALPFLMGATGMSELDALNVYTSLLSKYSAEGDTLIEESGYTITYTLEEQQEGAMVRVILVAPFLFSEL